MNAATDHVGLLWFSELLGFPAPSGREERLIEELSRRVRAFGFEPEADPSGNLLVRVAGRDSRTKTCLAAHVDEIGVVITRILPDGTLVANRHGGLHPWKLGEGPVEILGDRETVVGVVSHGVGACALRLRPDRGLVRRADSHRPVD